MKFITFLIYTNIAFGFFFQSFFMREMELSLAIQSSIFWPVIAGMELADYGMDLKNRNKGE